MNISQNEYIAICTGVQRDGNVIAATVNRAKSSSKELEEIFRGHIAEVVLVHSYIKDTYDHYRGVAIKYINRYDALFSIAFRCANSLKDTLFASLYSIGRNCYWHSLKNVRHHQLVALWDSTNIFFD